MMPDYEAQPEDEAYESYRDQQYEQFVVEQVEDDGVQVEDDGRCGCSIFDPYEACDRHLAEHKARAARARVMR
jgi:hypothetical protein